MKRLSIVPSWARQAKRDKPQRFKQLPTSWWSVLHAYLKKLRRAAQKSSTSCQTTVNHSPHPSAPIKTLHQKVYPKQQLWQRLKGPSTDSHSTLGSNITSSFFQPSVNFSLRLSPAIPAGSHSFAHRGLSALSMNHPSLKVSGISQLIDMNLLLKYASVKPLPLIIHTSTPTLSILPLPESQHNQKKAALVYLPKQINPLPPLLPIMEVDRPPQPLDADGQWLANKPQVIDPAVKITNPSPEEPTVTKTQSEKPIQRKSQNTKCEIDYFFNISKKCQASIKFQKSRKRSNPYSDLELAEPPKKRAKLVSCYEPKEPTIIEAKSDKQTQGSFQNIILKRAVVFDTSKNEFQESRKCYNLFGSELAESPTKRDKLASNPDPDKTIASLLESENKVICSSVEITNPSLKESTVKETESEKSTQKKSQDNIFKKAVFFCRRQEYVASNKFQESRKRCNSYSGSELIELSKKRAKLASNPDPDEIGIPLIESENKDKQSVECDDYRVETTSEKTDSTTEKWSGSELSNSEPSETETAIESDWCYTLAAYGYDTQRYPLLTQLPDDCNWGKNILRDFKPEYTFWLDFEEKSLLCGARYYPELAEFLQIDPLTYQHPYLEQSINAYTTPSESLLSLAKVDNCPSDSTFKNINLTNSLLIGRS